MLKFGCQKRVQNELSGSHLPTNSDAFRLLMFLRLNSIKRSHNWTILDTDFDGASFNVNFCSVWGTSKFGKHYPVVAESKDSTPEYWFWGLYPHEAPCMVTTQVWVSSFLTAIVTMQSWRRTGKEAVNRTKRTRRNLLVIYVITLILPQVEH